MNSRVPTYAWYAVYTKANREKKIIELLNEENIECYLPLRKSLKQWSDRKKWIEEPMFRCYVFVRISYFEYYNVLMIPGVVSYVCFGGKAQPIPDVQIENVKTFVKQEEKEIVLTHEHIAKGIKVQVQYGPLKGIQGEIVQIFGQSRLLIRIESMGCSIYANISKDEIKLLKFEGINTLKYTRNRKMAVSV